MLGIARASSGAGVLPWAIRRCWQGPGRSADRRPTTTSTSSLRALRSYGTVLGYHATRRAVFGAGPSSQTPPVHDLSISVDSAVLAECARAMLYVVLLFWM